jgi:hypothetical protein
MGFVKNYLTWFSIQEEFFERNVAYLQRQQTYSRVGDACTPTASTCTLLAGHTMELVFSVGTGGSMVLWHCEQTLQLDGQHSAQQKLAPSSDPSAQECYELHEPQRTSKPPFNVDLLRYEMCF